MGGGVEAIECHCFPWKYVEKNKVIKDWKEG
jgi:hypothetical protein